LPATVSFAIAIAALAVVVGGLGGSMPISIVVALGAACLLASALPLLARGMAGRENWFHPLYMPTAYVAFALLVPLAYVTATQRSVGGTPPHAVSLTLVGALALTVAGFVGGVVMSLLWVEQAAGTDAPRQWHRVLRVGRGLLLIAIVLRGYSTIRSWGTPYGNGAVDFGAEGTVQTVTDFLSVTAPALIVLAQARLHGRIAGALDLVLFGTFCVITLVAGSRGELLVPVIFALWLYHRELGPISLRVVAGGCVIVVLLFQAVQGVRAGESPLASPRAAIERTLTSVGVPLQVTSLTTASVPSRADYRLGATYIESLKRQLPGLVAVKLWGEPDETGTFVLRRIIGFNSPDAGLGFALPAESYLNFGVAGSLIIALLVGLLFGYAYQKQRAVRLSRASHLLYGFLIATLPLSLRADAVLQVKAVLYPAIAVAIVLEVCRE
jgi:oligosaccharide repeat unit polymerase